VRMPPLYRPAGWIIVRALDYGGLVFENDDRTRWPRRWRRSRKADRILQA
jgi:hypothetical protein